MMLKYLSVAVIIFGISTPEAGESLRYILTDTTQNLDQETFEIKGSDHTPDCSFSWSVRKYTLYGGLQEGIEIIEVDNGKLRLDIVPTHGMSIMHVSMGDLSLGRNPDKKTSVNSKFDNSQTSRDQEENVTEWMIRDGMNLSTAPASSVEVFVERKAPYRITIRGKIESTNTKGQKLELITDVSTVPGTNTFRISDTLINRSTSEQSLDIKYKTYYGTDFIGKNSKLLAPVRQITPVNEQSAQNISTYNLSSVTMPGTAEQIYSMQLWSDQNGRSKVLLYNTTDDKAVSMAFSTKQFPFIDLLKQPASNQDDYAMALGIHTNSLINRTNESTSSGILNLSTDQSRSFTIDFTFHTNKDLLTSVADEITQIQAGRKTTINTSSFAGEKINLDDIIKAARTWEPAFQNWHGKPAPDFALVDITGKVQRLSNYKGKNVLVIFWATWCGPCLREIPDLIELRKTFSRNELVMLAISNENPNTVKNFAAQAKINYDVLLDQGTLPAPYNSIKAIPSSFFIDPEGKIKLATIGMISLKELKMILKAK